MAQTTLNNRQIELQAPEGFLLNGKIVPSVASDDLTVALKTLAGNDPSASDPIYIRLDNTIRTITGALSVTANDGTNWFNAGSTELATKEIDYFVYLGYNSTDGVVIGFSRIPYATKYSEFNTTTTNEKYAKISTITNASSDDYYSVIGRFSATLSAGAGYTWTVPTFNASNLIQRPIYETRWLDYLPTIAIWTNAPTSQTLTGRYRIDGRNAFVYCQITGTANANNSGTIVATKLPINGAYPAGFGNGGKYPGIITAQWTDNATFDDTPAFQAQIFTNGNLYTQFSSSTRKPTNYLASGQYSIQA